jgi:hypothetical protein
LKAPSSSSIVERKKKRRRRGEGMNPSLHAPGACELRHRRRRVQRQESHELSTYSLLLWI